MVLKENNRTLLLKIIIFSILAAIFNCILVWFSGLETCRIVIENIVIPNLFIMDNYKIALVMNEYFFMPRLIFMIFSNVFFGFLLYLFIKDYKKLI